MPSQWATLLFSGLSPQAAKWFSTGPCPRCLVGNEAHEYPSSFIRSHGPDRSIVNIVQAPLRLVHIPILFNAGLTLLEPLPACVQGVSLFPAHRLSTIRPSDPPASERGECRRDRRGPYRRGVADDRVIATLAAGMVKRMDAGPAGLAFFNDGRLQAHRIDPRNLKTLRKEISKILRPPGPGLINRRVKVNFVLSPTPSRVLCEFLQCKGCICLGIAPTRRTVTRVLQTAVNYIGAL
jgi:hypothetical protein